VLSRLSLGDSNAKIARYLGLSEKTVRNQLKIGVSDRVQAALRARDAGLTPPPRSGRSAGQVPVRDLVSAAAGAHGEGNDPGGYRRALRHEEQKMTIRQILTSTVAAAAALAMTATPALAAPSPSASALPRQVCRGDGFGSSWCLFIERTTNGEFRVHLGIDVFMSRGDAQAIIDAPGDPFSARLIGRDSFPDTDDNLFNVPITILGAADGIGLSSDFDTVVGAQFLNEDNVPGNRGDEAFGKITFRNPLTKRTSTFDTPEIDENF
jgi:hypothetical protein